MTVTLKEDTVTDGTYLDNTGNYSLPLDAIIDTSMFWYDYADNTLNWEPGDYAAFDIYWGNVLISVIDKAKLVHKNDLSYLTMLERLSLLENDIFNDNYYTKDEINDKINQLTALSPSIYDGSSPATVGDVIALNDYGIMPVVDGRYITNIRLTNIKDLSISKPSNQFLNGTGNYSNISLNTLVDTVTNGDGSTVLTNAGIYKVLDINDINGIGTAANYDYSSSITNSDVYDIPNIYAVKSYVDEQISLIGSPASGLGTVSTKNYVNNIISDSYDIPTVHAILEYGNVNWSGGSSSIQADWNETNSSFSSYIKNKPDISAFNGRSIKNTADEHWKYDQNIPTCNAVYELFELYQSTIQHKEIDHLILTDSNHLATGSAIIAYGNMYWNSVEDHWNDYGFYISPKINTHCSITTTGLVITNLPTSDPGVVGSFWRDGNNLKVSI